MADLVKRLREASDKDAPLSIAAESIAGLLNALICMTGWAKSYAEKMGWTPENSASIWAGINHAESVLDKAMGGPKPPGYYAPKKHDQA